MKIKIIANRDNSIIKEYFRLSEEHGPTSEFYSDDEAITTMVDDLRSEYAQLSSPQAVTTMVNQVKEVDYDDLLNNM